MKLQRQPKPRKTTDPEPVPESHGRKKSRFLLLVGMLLLVPVAWIVVNLQRNPETRLDNILDKEQRAKFKETFTETMKEHAQEAKKTLDEQIMPVVKEKAQDAALTIKEDVVPVVKEQMENFVKIAESKINAWKEEKKKLARTIEGDEAMRRKFEDFEKRGIDELEKSILEAPSGHPRDPSILTGYAYDRANKDMAYARDLMREARQTSSHDQAAYTYNKAASAYRDSLQFWKMAGTKATLPNEREIIHDNIEEIEQSIALCDAKIQQFLSRPATVSDTTKVAALPKPAVRQAPSSASSSGATPPSASRTTGEKTAAKPATATVATAVRHPSVHRPSPAAPPRPPSKPAGLQGDPDYITAKAKLSEGIEWYRKGQRSSGKKRNQYLKQALLRLDTAMSSLEKLDGNPAYRKDPGDSRILDDIIQKTNFLRYACMKHSTL